jgi:Predicted membrane protein (DUF2157)
VAEKIEKKVERWLAAGIVDSPTAERIRKFEAEHRESERRRWPVHIALALGGLLVCAGILLFVAAHWEELSPSWRFTLVLILVGLFPIAGALTAERFRALSLTFHAIGTICVGAGIFLAAQIFNLQEHWPNAILMWAIGALAGWILVQHWSQAILVAILVPAWLVGEWEVRTEEYRLGEFVVAAGLLLLALTYLSAVESQKDSKERVALAWVGGIALIPCAVWAFVERSEYWRWWRELPAAPHEIKVVGWCIAIGAPLLLALILRGRASWMNAISAVWVLLIGTIHPASSGGGKSLLTFSWDSLGGYILAGLGALGLVAWGFVEKRSERINLGIAGFALTVIVFYFSDVMDKLGRSASLIGMGVLFLLGGWSLERLRRRLVGEMQRREA